MTSPIELELQQHTAALRRLARSLVGERWADDLVQDTVVQALQAGTAPRSWGAWLGTVLRFLAHKHRRTERRRASREAEVALRDPAPKADDAIEQGETLRDLTDAVLALPQPYRQIVLLRYLHE
ncbi:MAG TPA: sigma-70 family RNA polymerase sigma factor, partial [Planctomycetota bacterium]|nr:sigma-70 family RNA polymerase sigma factor [Planctomycetota bacterium]